MKTIITEMGYLPANDADNLVTRKLSASKPLELKASVLHTLLLTNGASVKKVPKLLGFLSTVELGNKELFGRPKIVP